MIVKGNFKFEAAAASLVKSINGVLLGTSTFSGTKNTYLASNGRDLYVVGITGCLVMLKVPNSRVEGSGSINIELEPLKGMLNNRGNLAFEVGKELKFKGIKSKYSGSIRPSLDITEEQTMVFKTMYQTSKGVALDKELFSLIKSNIELLKLQDTVTSNDMLTHIDLNDGNLVLSTQDAHHFGLISMPCKGELRLSVLTTLLPTIDKIISEYDEKDITFDISTGKVTLLGKNFRVAFPSTQVNKTAFNLVPDFLGNLFKKKSSKFTINIDSMLRVLNNLFSLNTKNPVFSLTFDKELSIEFTSTRGTASDVVPIKEGSTRLKLKIDGAVLMDCLKQLPGIDVNVLIWDTCIGFKYAVKKKEVIYVCSIIELDLK